MPTSGRDQLTVPAEFWQRQEVTETLQTRDIARLFRLLRQYCGASQTRIGTTVGMTQSTVSLIINRNKPVTTLAVLERIADGLGMPDECRMRLGLAPKETDSVRRRTALGLGLAATLNPSTLADILRESAAEAMEFTQARGMSSVAIGTLDHLEEVIADLDQASRWRPASELFPVARTYRQRVEALITSRHTLAEARELYVRAANLSELLSTLTSDLGSRLAAEAYAIDSYRHAQLAGHHEATAWAAGALASLAVRAGRADKAVDAAQRGLSRAPDRSPIAAQLHAKAARGYAQQGNRAACTAQLAEAKAQCDRLRDGSTQLEKERSTRAPYMVAKYAAESHNLLQDYQAAEREARTGLAVEAWSPGDADLIHLELAIALAGQGAIDEAIEHGRHALAKPRHLISVLSRARQLDAVLTSRYPKAAGSYEFREQLEVLVSRRAR